MRSSGLSIALSWHSEAPLVLAALAFDDVPAAPRVSPAEAVIAAAESDPAYQEWRRRRAEQDRRYVTTPSGC